MIRFHQVYKRFQRTDVLAGIDLEIAQGDRVALVGSNGAGKTTLIRCLLGEYQCQGEVSVNGHDPRQQRTEILKHVGFVPQISPPLKMQVGQLIRFAAGVCDSDPSRMLAVSLQLGLDADRIRRQPFNKLSGGQKQKLLISIALGRDCDLLVLDEPAANLDPEARHTFFQLLAARQEQIALHSYDPANRTFECLIGCPPPGLYRRALVSCSGVLGAVSGGRLIYEHVPQELGYLILSKLYRKESDA